jgi:putative spermidine/putrescine transport system permease protein
VVLLATAVYFLLPLWAALRFAGISAFGSVVGESGFSSSLGLSVRLAVITTVITIALMLPTAVYVHLRLPGLRRLLEGITILPIVIPPVVMAAGIAFVQANLGGPVFRALFDSSTSALTPFYVILALPFAYRAVDNGLAAIPLRTLVEAARNLGAGMTTALVRVVLPAIRSAVLGAAFLTLALVLGEIVIARILLYTDTFPIAVVEVGRSAAGVSVALSLASLLLTWVLLLAVSFVGTRRRRSS